MQVQGFLAAAVQAGIRYEGRLDLGLIFSTVPAVTAGAFTTNRVKAAPLMLDMERLQSGKAQAILVNSGNANACTGEAGMRLAVDASALLAKKLGIAEDLVQVASTGVIGQTPSLDPFARAIPGLVRQLAPEGFADLARAIMTTDITVKIASAKVMIGNTQISLLGVAKGSGMIMPNMATMLCFVVTDAHIAFPVLNRLLKNSVERSFNCITVDGDTSTNDMILAMANGAAGNDRIDDDKSEAVHLFGEALDKICKDLAIKIVEDGEGATKLVRIRVTGARNEEEAMSGARTIANSALVKTAFFGEDANWGRIMAALGRSECSFDPNKVSISFNEVLLVAGGMVLGPQAEAAATQVLKEKNFTLTVGLEEGSAEAEVYTCDFSYDYVKINADYRS